MCLTCFNCANVALAQDVLWRKCRVKKVAKNRWRRNLLTPSETNFEQHKGSTRRCFTDINMDVPAVKPVTQMLCNPSCHHWSKAVPNGWPACLNMPNDLLRTYCWPDLSPNSMQVYDQNGSNRPCWPQADLACQQASAQPFWAAASQFPSSLLDSMVWRWCSHQSLDHLGPLGHPWPARMASIKLVQRLTSYKSTSVQWGTTTTYDELQVEPVQGGVAEVSRFKKCDAVGSKDKVCL